MCTVAAKWSFYLPPTFSLSTLFRCLGVCLLCPIIIKNTLPPSPPLHISLFPPPSPSSPPLLSTFFFLPPSFSLPFSLIIQQLEATSQPYVSENCHLSLLVCIISSRLFALNFALNLGLFLFFLTVKLINQAARSQHSAICESIS